MPNEVEGNQVYSALVSSGSVLSLFLSHCFDLVVACFYSISLHHTHASTCVVAVVVITPTVEVTLVVVMLMVNDKP